jgi:hypothetical protein
VRASVRVKVGIAHRPGRRGVERTTHVEVLDGEQCEASFVIEMNPGHPLFSAPDATTEPGPKNGVMARKRTAFVSEHNSSAQQHHATTRCLERSSFPSLAGFGEKTCARGCCFGEFVIARVSVESRSPSRKPKPREAR